MRTVKDLLHNFLVKNNLTNKLPTCQNVVGDSRLISRSTFVSSSVTESQLKQGKEKLAAVFSAVTLTSQTYQADSLPHQRGDPQHMFLTSFRKRRRRFFVSSLLPDEFEFNVVPEE